MENYPEVTKTFFNKYGAFSSNKDARSLYEASDKFAKEMFNTYVNMGYSPEEIMSLIISAVVGMYSFMKLTGGHAIYKQEKIGEEMDKQTKN